MSTFTYRTMGPGVRCHWQIDPHHRTRGSYGYDTEAETRAAEEEEIAKLNSGEWAALGCIVEHQCEKCGDWFEGDSCWGIVTETDGPTLDSFARDQFTLKNSPTCDRCHQAYLLESAAEYLKRVDFEIHGLHNAHYLRVHLQDMAKGLRER